jgi:hypothetical protein
MFATKSTAASVLPAIERMREPSRARVSSNVPASNWTLPRPPWRAEHGPSPAPATTGPPPQSALSGPWQAQVSSDQQWLMLVSASAMPASSHPCSIPAAKAASGSAGAHLRSMAERLGAHAGSSPSMASGGRLVLRRRSRARRDRAIRAIVRSIAP